MFPFDSALDFGQQDFWILHSSLSSTMVLGRSLTALNLFDYLSPRADMGALLDPPPNPRCDTGGGTHSPNCSDFQYYAQFSDGTFESGGLLSLTLVPEMPSLALLPLGLIGILLVYRPERAEA